MPKVTISIIFLALLVAGLQTKTSNEFQSIMPLQHGIGKSDIETYKDMRRVRKVWQR